MATVDRILRPVGEGSLYSDFFDPGEERAGSRDRIMEASSPANDPVRLSVRFLKFKRLMTKTTDARFQYGRAGEQVKLRMFGFPLPRLVFPLPSPPFLATTNIPLIKHPLRSSSPRARRSSASASSTPRKTPSRTHCWNRRWQVWYGGNPSGKSSHQAPLLKTRRMPFITSRLSFQGLPLEILDMPRDHTLCSRPD